MNSLISSSPKTFLTCSVGSNWALSKWKTMPPLSPVHVCVGCYCREGGALGPLEWRKWGREENGIPPAASSGLLPQWPGTKPSRGKSFGKDIDNWALDSGSVEIKTHRINCLAQTMPWENENLIRKEMIEWNLKDESNRNMSRSVQTCWLTSVVNTEEHGCWEF